MSKPFVVYNLAGTYPELGHYEFKVVLDPKLFRNSHASSVTMADSDGKSMECDVDRWGRKMNCCFRIDETVSDGVALIRLFLRDDADKEREERLTCWIIKP